LRRGGRTLGSDVAITALEDVRTLDGSSAALNVGGVGTVRDHGVVESTDESKLSNGRLDRSVGVPVRRSRRIGIRP
jgi:hypothetical protein